MNIEIVNVGTELLLGEIVNTNAVKIFELCKEMGFNVYYQTTVGDNPDRLLDVLETAFKRGADMVITTGGLGPTMDDLTKELSAQYLNLELEYIPEEAQKVEEKCQFVSQTSKLTDNNYKQAYFPLNAYILENPVGTANGCIMENNGKMIVNLPGPPKEMNYVLSHSLKPYLEKYRQERLYTYDYLEMGIGESKVDSMLEEIQTKTNRVTTSMYAGEAMVRIRLACKAKSEEEANSYMLPYKQYIEDKLKDYLIPEADITKALESILIPFTYQGSIPLPDYFEKYVTNESNLHIQMSKIHENLGDVITLQINEKKYTIKVLHDYRLSMKWLENKIKMYLYYYLK